MIITTFSEIQYIDISKKGDLMAAVSRYGNKIHIYSLNDFHLKFCLFLTLAEHKIFNLNFDSKSRFISMLSFDGLDLNLNLFDLKHSKSDNQLCQCDDYDDSQVKLISGEKKERNSFFGSLVNKISNVIFNLFYSPSLRQMTLFHSLMEE
jgi:hypothetical protein